MYVVTSVMSCLSCCLIQRAVLILLYVVTKEGKGEAKLWRNESALLYVNAIAAALIQVLTVLATQAWPDKKGV